MKNAKFSLRNRQKQTIYETQLQLTDAPGVIHVSLPTKAPSLEVNQWYQYYLFLDINCTSNQFLSKEVTQAWVKRETINPSFQTQLETMSPSQRGLFYAQNGIWYDAIASFAQMKLTSGINSYWSEILESIGLGKIAHLQPTNCCEFSPTSDR
ncbi:MAG: DUF928 domain-containing protein [Richelia sp. SL_2_1]|nr:DUF928 domain-containing protein [Richelia sp. SM2_1_7]NJM18232.1 DUF928 domain-containing protein [Richelia sp. SM1_7_0]NJO26128.1 DUF928 domain-containing protein [Richelia sp. SL_2_1]